MKRNEVELRAENDGSYTVIVNGLDEARFDNSNGDALSMAYAYGKSRQQGL